MRKRLFSLVLDTGPGLAAADFRPEYDPVGTIR